MKNDHVTRKDLKETVEQAVVDIVTAINKTLENFATKDDLNGVEHRLDVQIKDLKREINDLKADIPTPQEFQNHEKRILRLENTVFNP